MFQTFSLDFSASPFGELASLPMSRVVEGRQAGILVVPNENGDIPLVRGTTVSPIPATLLPSSAEEILKQICKKSGLQPAFNNIMVETYNDNYRTMKYHSDQMTDLEEPSYIAIFSCYAPQTHSYPRNTLRTFMYKPKGDEGVEPTKIVLQDMSVVLFSTEFNRKYVHKIVLERSGLNGDEVWLGLTCRLSKSFVRFDDGVPRLLPSGVPLTLTTEQERRALYENRNKENKLDYVYPESAYTLSPGDLLAAISH